MHRHLPRMRTPIAILVGRTRIYLSHLSPYIYHDIRRSAQRRRLLLSLFLFFLSLLFLLRDDSRTHARTLYLDTIPIYRRTSVVCISHQGISSRLIRSHSPLLVLGIPGPPPARPRTTTPHGRVYSVSPTAEWPSSLLCNE